MKGCFLVFLLLLAGCHSTKKKEFAIIIPSYNNESICEWNLKSALSQKYDHFHVYYIDDASTDCTFERVKAVIESLNASERVTVVRNTNNQGALRNIYQTIHQYISDDAIVILLDGDDAFANPYVLSYLNQLYSSKIKEVWLTYGQYQCVYSGEKGFCKHIPKEVVKNNSFRSYKQIPSHLRSFYAWLFKRISRDDLLIDGQFYPMTWDIAIMLPMIEMAGERFQFISRVLYLYNDANPLSDHCKNKIHQRTLDLYLRSKQPYQRLSDKNLQG